MAESSVIDLRDRSNPPPDDPVNAPYGYRWDTRKKEWSVKRSAGGRKAGAAWFGKDNKPEPELAAEEMLPPDGDPEPSYMSKTPPKTPRKTPPKASKQVKDDLTGAIGMVGMVVLPALSSRDPYCGQILTQQYPAIADALVPLLCKSTTVIAFFSGDHGDWMLWIQLLTACMPVVMAVGKHHLIKSVEVQEDEEGNLFAVQRDLSEYAA